MVMRRMDATWTPSMRCQRPCWTCPRLRLLHPPGVYMPRSHRLCCHSSAATAAAAAAAGNEVDVTDAFVHTAA
eukprot:570669-Pelagomonas_calceolata.AAC.1